MNVLDVGRMLYHRWSMTGLCSSSSTSLYDYQYTVRLSAAAAAANRSPHHCSTSRLHRHQLLDVMSLNWTYVDNVTSSTLWSLNYSVPEMAVVTAILVVMIAVTACGNAMVGVALLRCRSLRCVSNMLIGNLAVSDFLLAVIVLPLSTVNECLGRWPLGNVACNVWLTVDVLCCTASIWNLCMIAVDRHTAVVYPLWYRHKRSMRHAVPYVAAVWLLSTAVSAPPSLLGWSDVYVVDAESDATQCVLYQSRGYVLFSASASFFVPFSITVILYVRIFTLLLRRMAVTRTMTSSLKTVTGCHRVTGRLCILCTRHPPHADDIDNRDSVAGHSTATERTCQTNIPDTPHLTVPPTTTTTSPAPSELAAVDSSHQQRGRMRTWSRGDADGRHRDSAAASYRRDHREIVVSVRMAIIVVVFGGMWMGFFVVYVMRSWCSTCHVPRQLDAFFFWLGYANSSVNPILYTIFNADFRRAFKDIVAVCRRCVVNR